MIPTISTISYPTFNSPVGSILRLPNPKPIQLWILWTLHDFHLMHWCIPKQDQRAQVYQKIRLSLNIPVPKEILDILIKEVDDLLEVDIHPKVGRNARILYPDNKKMSRLNVTQSNSTNQKIKGWPQPTLLESRQPYYISTNKFKAEYCNVSSNSRIRLYEKSLT